MFLDKTIRMQCDLPTELKQDLDQIIGRSGVRISDVVRDAISFFMIYTGTKNSYTYWYEKNDESNTRMPVEISESKYKSMKVGKYKLQFYVAKVNKERIEEFMRLYIS